MTTQYLQHLASEDDRWDSLAYQYYGDSTGYERIIASNRHLPIGATLSAGQIVFIPIIVKDTNAHAVPAWLRDDEQ
ncbi:MAG: tail protein X [Moraxella sp.]|nr:tail protein X [Moraxella sp.]